MALRSFATALRSFQDTYRREPRTMWTMQSWTCVFGKTASIASGKPASPSMEAMRMCWTPRFFSSVSTPSQNLAPSASSTQSPRSSLSSDRMRARAR